ncbi:Tn3 family transposase [Heyndrickxia sporothermodurans]|uniref:Uncharacterized protein n=1 Tax=Heyndrickxia sporothermodurans TaxID=46224 RepID=A0A150KKR2_9BACI|nr:Tn3 family transposase [Heyndrickxia sporothermodurans]KYC89893.1 hypothetical protein B4102_3900 [Heyndrickxia sporothermodurans]MEB6550814.1 Tn3 family transposase [Heyndrickxia sporothermodurans]MED3652256.1 Tn3 family transposase [Heyndrickxia sporothermodurans]MED3655531.1 Tn3 family transposase [Heyndrickxia sporothermodurans]MED3696837.1 Tn3 family transposase [Heyndrickxia sporothermodurans]
MCRKGRFILKFGYARVSTQDQSLSLQLDALNHYEVDEIFEEKESGKRKNRPKLDELLKVLRKGDTVVDDVLRLAHSIREGTVSASLIMGKLGSYSHQNSLATTLREMGRIDKILFILDYISSETLRRRIQRGLNKGVAMNALALAIFFGKQGELRERALQDQLQRASALNLIINAISIWTLDNPIHNSFSVGFNNTAKIYAVASICMRVEVLIIMLNSFNRCYNNKKGDTNSYTNCIPDEVVN